MKNTKQTNAVLKAIGTLSILAAIYGVFTGQSFQHYFYGLVIGSILLGSGYVDQNEGEKKEYKK